MEPDDEIDMVAGYVDDETNYQLPKFTKLYLNTMILNRDKHIHILRTKLKKRDKALDKFSPFLDSKGVERRFNNMEEKVLDLSKQVQTLQAELSRWRKQSFVLDTEGLILEDEDTDESK